MGKQKYIWGFLGFGSGIYTLFNFIGNASDTFTSPVHAKENLLIALLFVVFLVLFIISDLFYHSTIKRPPSEAEEKIITPLSSDLKHALLLLLFMLTCIFLLCSSIGLDKIAETPLPDPFNKVDIFQHLDFLRTSPSGKEIAAHQDSSLDPKITQITPTPPTRNKPQTQKPIPIATDAHKGTMSYPIIAIVYTTNSFTETLASSLRKKLNELIQKTFDKTHEKVTAKVEIRLNAKSLDPTNGVFSVNGRIRFHSLGKPFVDCSLGWGHFSNYTVAAEYIAEQISPSLQRLVKEGKIICLNN